uniref:Uncharacterized protein n=1 Tax=Acrobeloides nanus TaxID=290746 RepID=A0A914BZP9_9BILA
MFLNEEIIDEVFNGKSRTVSGNSSTVPPSDGTMELEAINSGKNQQNLELKKFKVSLLPYLLAVPDGFRLNELIEDWENNEKEDLESIARKFDYDSILKMLLSEEFEDIIRVEKISENDQDSFIFHGRDDQNTSFVTKEIHKSQQYKMIKEMKERNRRENRIYQPDYQLKAIDGKKRILDVAVELGAETRKVYFVEIMQGYLDKYKRKLDDRELGKYFEQNVKFTIFNKVFYDEVDMNTEKTEDGQTFWIQLKKPYNDIKMDWDKKKQELERKLKNETPNISRPIGRSTGTNFMYNSRRNSPLEKRNSPLVSMQQAQNRFQNIPVEPFQRHRHRASSRQSLMENFDTKFKYVEGTIVREQGSPFETKVMGERPAHTQANTYAPPQNSSTDEESQEEPLDFGIPSSGTSGEDEEVEFEKPQITQAFMKEKTRVDDRNMSIDETISKYRDFLDEDLIKLHKRNDETITKYRDYLDEDIIKQVVHSQDAPGPSRSIKEPQRPQIQWPQAQELDSDITLSFGPSGEIKPSPTRLQLLPTHSDKSSSIPAKSGHNPPPALRGPPTRQQAKSNQILGEKEQYLSEKNLSASQSYDQNMHRAQPMQKIYSPPITKAPNRRGPMPNEDQRGIRSRFIPPIPVAEQNHVDYSPRNRQILRQEPMHRQTGFDEESEKRPAAEIGSVDLSYRNKARGPRVGSEAGTTRAGPQSFAPSSTNYDQGSSFDQSHRDKNPEDYFVFNQSQRRPQNDTYFERPRRSAQNRTYMDQSMAYRQHPRQALPMHSEDHEDIPPLRRNPNPLYQGPHAIPEDDFYVQENYRNSQYEASWDPTQRNSQYEASWDPTQRSKSVMNVSSRMEYYDNPPMVERQRPDSRASVSTAISRSRLPYDHPGRVPMQNNFVTINGDHYKIEDPQDRLASVINLAIMTQFPDMVLAERLPQLVQQMMGNNYIDPYYAFGKNWHRFINENCPQIDINVLYNRKYLCWRSK